MPAQSAITELGWTLLEELPAFLQADPNIRAVQHAYAKEIERLEAKIAEAAQQANGPASSLLLAEWERTLDLPVAPIGLTEAQRRSVILAFMGSLSSDPSGTHWHAVIKVLLSSGIIAIEHRAGGAEPQPAANEIHAVLPFGEFAPLFGILSRLLRRITPAHVKLTITGEEGFTTDKTELDHIPPMH
ncbi:MAG: hypothetical protein KGL39_38205 [Patescibacteria group bacterium]|nr:hypothetical protein [Patescibacteria group bacterium]